MARRSGTAAVVGAGLVVGGLLALGGRGDGPDTVMAASPVPTTTVSTSTSTSTSTTSTTTTSTTTTSTIVSVSVVAPPVPPLPLVVEPATIMTATGGVWSISGTCPVTEGGPLGPVEIWEVGGSIVRIPTGISADSWTFDWVAPPVVITPLVLQVWCGDPSAYGGGYPLDRQITVQFVQQEVVTVSSATEVSTVPSIDLPITH